MNCVGLIGINNLNNVKLWFLKILGVYNEVGLFFIVDLYYNKGVERVIFGNKFIFFMLKNGEVLFIN